MFCPKHLHELALKRIGHYLKQTSDHGMVMNPSRNVCKIDAYPDADFAGMYSHEDHTDPACAKSHMGFIITFVECPVFWQLKLQTETAYPRWKPKSLLFLHAAESCFSSSTWFLCWLRPPIFLLEI